MHGQAAFAAIRRVDGGPSSRAAGSGPIALKRGSNDPADSRRCPITSRVVARECPGGPGIKPGDHRGHQPRRPAAADPRALIKESDCAAIICIGSAGIGRIASKVLGSTAKNVAKNAHWPVAIIRHSNEPPSGSISVVVDESPGDDTALEHSFREARLREVPILAMGVWRWGTEIPYRQLDHRLGPWLAQYPEVHVQPAAARNGVAEFLSHTEEAVQLAVVASEDADKVAQTVGRITPHLSGHAGCSILVVRK